MRMTSLLGLLILVACSAAERTAAGEAVSTGTTLTGWYLEHAGESRFQPCGQTQPLRVVAAADLPARAKAFGLDEDTPVYVRLTGSISGGEVRVAAVEQFGSPIPVRNCGLTGVVNPETDR